MDYSLLTTTISTLGFPIVACCYMAYVNKKQSEAHKEEMIKMTGAINSLEIAINTLAQRFAN